MINKLFPNYEKYKTQRKHENGCYTTIRQGVILPNGSTQELGFKVGILSYITIFVFLVLAVCILAKLTTPSEICKWFIGAVRDSPKFDLYGMCRDMGLKVDGISRPALAALWIGLKACFWVRVILPGFLQYYSLNDDETELMDLWKAPRAATLVFEMLAIVGVITTQHFGL